MLQANPALVAHDALTLTLWLSVWDRDAHLSEVRVRDRWGATLFHARPDPPAPVVDVHLERVARARCPLFVEAVDGEGTPVPSPAAGPIFPAPTEPAFTGGFPLPAGAVAAESDPVIRGSLAEGRASGRRRQHLEQEIRELDLAVRGALERWRTPLILAAVFAAAGAAHAGDSRAPWLGATLVAAAALVVVPVVTRIPRVRALQRQRAGRMAELEHEAERGEQVRGRLRAWGVDPDRLPDGECRCGGRR